MSKIKNMSQEEIIQYLEKMLDDLLKKRPELKKLQAQIDEIKIQAGDNPENRIKAINLFFEKYIREEFLPEMNKIKETNLKIQEEIGTLQERAGIVPHNKRLH